MIIFNSQVKAALDCLRKAAEERAGPGPCSKFVVAEGDQMAEEDRVSYMSTSKRYVRINLIDGVKLFGQITEINEYLFCEKLFLEFTKKGFRILNNMANFVSCLKRWSQIDDKQSEEAQSLVEICNVMNNMQIVYISKLPSDQGLEGIWKAVEIHN